MKCGMKLFIHSQTPTVVHLKFGMQSNAYVIPSHLLPSMCLLIHAGIKINPYQKRRPCLKEPSVVGLVHVAINLLHISAVAI